MTTRFAGMKPWPARGVLAAAVLAAALGVATPTTAARWDYGVQAVPDLDLYRREMEQVRAGGNYYDACHEGLREIGYQTHSVFHWRQPTLTTLLGHSPDPDIFRWLLPLAALGSVLAAVRTLAPQDSLAAAATAAVLLLGGAFAWSLYEPDSYFGTEPWCEVILLLSLSAYARDRWPAAVALGAAALALRELAVPYCVAMAAMAAWRRNRREVVAWGIVFALYAAFFAWHKGQIAMREPTASPAALESWLRAPNLEFVLSSCVMNAILRPFPQWVAALYLTAALVGLAGWPGREGRRMLLAAGVYVVPFVFLFASDYWGYFYCGVLILGVVRAPAALRDLVKAARGRKAVEHSDSP